MIRIGVLTLALLSVISVLIIASCGAGTNDHPGSISGKFSAAGGKLKANKATLIVPPNSVTLTDTGKGEAESDDRGRELSMVFTLTESTFQPSFFIDGSVYVLQAVSIFDAEITSPLTFKIEYNEFSMLPGYGANDLCIAHYNISTGVTTELVSKHNAAEQMIEAQIVSLGTYFLKPKSFTGKLASKGTTLNYRAQSGVTLTGFNAAVPPWNVKNLALGFSFQTSYKQPLSDMPLVSGFPAVEMALTYNSSGPLENAFWGDSLPAFTDDEWPTNGLYAYLRQTRGGVEVLADLILETEVESADGTETLAGTISSQNYPALRFTQDGYPILGNLVSEGTVVTSAGNYFARVYRYDFLANSPEGWISWTWYAEVDKKIVPVAAVISRNANPDGVLIAPLTRCTVFDLATPVIF